VRDDRAAEVAGDEDRAEDRRAGHEVGDDDQRLDDADREMQAVGEAATRPRCT